MKTSYGRSMTSLASRRIRPGDVPAVLWSILPSVLCSLETKKRRRRLTVFLELEVGSTVHRIVSRETYSTDPKLKKSKITRDLDGSSIRSIGPCRHHPSRQSHSRSRKTWYSVSSDTDSAAQNREIVIRLRRTIQIQTPAFQHIESTHHTIRPKRDFPLNLTNPLRGSPVLPVTHFHLHIIVQWPSHNVAASPHRPA